MGVQALVLNNNNDDMIMTFDTDDSIIAANADARGGRRFHNPSGECRECADPGFGQPRECETLWFPAVSPCSSVPPS